MHVKRALVVAICGAALVPAGNALARSDGAGQTSQRPPAPTNLHTTSEPTTHAVEVAWNRSSTPSGKVDYFVTMDGGVLTWRLGRNITSAVLVWGNDPGGTHTFAIWASDPSDPANPSRLSNRITVTAAPR
jgi:hypothetical protein